MQPLGHPTRGTTGVNRLRRVDRWIAALPAVREPDALVVDLGFGASATTTLELHQRLARVNPSVEVVGFEIDPERVAIARAELARVAAADRTRLGRSVAERPRVRFERGGFEVATGKPPQVIRAMNVLRQYDEAEVPEIWERLTGRLAPGGRLVEGTSNEVGRVATWVTLSPAGPESLTLALKVDELGTPAMPSPSILQERLPKALIHRNVPGERIHALLCDLDAEWAAAAPHGVFGAGQRWERAVDALAARGWSVQHRRRVRLGEVTVPWAEVA